MLKDLDTIKMLAYLCRSYDGANKLITATRNRAHALNPDAHPKHDIIYKPIKALKSLKGSISRQIGKELELWPIWSEWAKQIKGVGPAIGGNLVLLYYYRLVPLCAKCSKLMSMQEKDGKTGWRCECGEASKGEGVFQHEVQIKDFANISKWWHYMGAHVDDGKMPKKAKGKKTTWSSKGRNTRWQVGEQFVKNKGDYRDFYDREKEELTKKFKDTLSKGHINNRAKVHTVKLFLSHWWLVAREIEGLPVTEPYSGTVLGHTGIIPPFCWHENKKVA